MSFTWLVNVKKIYLYKSKTTIRFGTEAAVRGGLMAPELLFSGRRFQLAQKVAIHPLND
uniref:Uncharacterized protein n=1 Tax=mine drainage metagenome TaxID=410659 RepID=E6QM35_9ZZZZ